MFSFFCALMDRTVIPKLFPSYLLLVWFHGSRQGQCGLARMLLSLHKQKTHAILHFFHGPTMKEEK